MRIIEEKTIENGFAEETKDDKTFNKTNFLNRIQALSVNVSQYLFSNKYLNEISKKVDNTIKKEHEMIDKSLNETMERLKGSEHVMLTHVLSLLGVFTAIITLIMSIVVSASSWLNNSNQASAIVGFAIPNLIALISVIILLSFVYIYLNHDKATDIRGSEKKSKTIKKPIVIFIYLVVISIVIISVTLAFVAASSIDKANEAHIQYVISESEYKVVEEQKGETGTQQYYSFELEGIIYKFEYDESLKHDDNLYFCKEHNSLE